MFVYSILADPQPELANERYRVARNGEVVALEHHNERRAAELVVFRETAGAADAVDAALMRQSGPSLASSSLSLAASHSRASRRLASCISSSVHIDMRLESACARAAVASVM